MDEKIKNLILEKRRYGIKEKVNFFEKKQLKKDKPIQKIIGYIEMANVRIDLSKKVLIPRYETEELIYHAIEFIKKNNYKSVLDLCCGSGFIGIALKKEFDNIDIWQSDIDKNAIKQTKKNLKINNVKNKIIKSNMFEKIKNKKFDLLISNPPYLTKNEILFKSVLNFEPHHALFADNNGMFFYEIIEEKLSEILNKDGLVILEINPINVDWFKKRNYFIIKDINNKERFAFKKINQLQNN